MFLMCGISSGGLEHDIGIVWLQVLYIVSLAAPEVWQDAQHPLTAPDIEPFVLQAGRLT